MKDNRYLIVEDEVENRNLVVELLIDDFGVPSDNIEESGDFEDATVKLDNFEPNIVLLDLKIPLQQGSEPSIKNATNFIAKVNNYNTTQYDNKDKVKIIVISGSVEDAGVKEFIKNNEIVVSFFDKGDIASDIKQFKKDFEKKIIKAGTQVFQEQKIDYSFVRNSILKDLNRINPEFKVKVEKDILKQFELFSNRNTNEYNISKSIIINCGQIIEDVIQFFITLGAPVNKNDSVLKKLISLSGRTHNGFDHGEANYNLTDNYYIRRVSQEYAYMVYKMSSHARHTEEGDINNNKWFTGFNAKFLKTDASIAVNLIIPLIQDYITYVKK